MPQLDPQPSEPSEKPVSRTRPALLLMTAGAALIAIAWRILSQGPGSRRRSLCLAATGPAGRIHGFAIHSNQN